MQIILEIDISVFVDPGKITAISDNMAVHAHLHRTSPVFSFKQRLPLLKKIKRFAKILIELKTIIVIGEQFLLKVTISAILL